MTQRIVIGVVLAWLVGTRFAAADRPTNWGTPLTKTATATTAVNTTTLWTPSSGNHIVLMGCVISASMATDVSLADGSSTTVVPPIRLASGGSQSIGFGAFPLWTGSADTALTYSSTGVGGRVSIVCAGWEE